MTDVLVRKAYTALAAQYIASFGSIQSVHADDLDMIRRHLGDQTGAVVDLGCGPGQLTGYLHALGVQVTGIDLVPEFISHARAAYPFAGFEVGSIASLGRPAHTLTGILAWYSLIHVAPTTLDSVLPRRRDPAPCSHRGPGDLATRPLTQKITHRRQRPQEPRARQASGMTP